jgi:hypothetical protein
MQIIINRTVPLDDLLTVETLHGYTFTKEQSGHVFDIACTANGEELYLEGTCYAYFRRADNTTVHLNTEDVAQIDDMTGHAVVTLHPDCYNVPGRFQLSVYNATESGTVCIYCAVGMVQAAVSGTMLDVSGKSGYDTAVFARNVGAIEGELETVRAENAGIIQALAGANVMYLNTPNLLKQNWWTNDGDHDIIYGNASMYSGSDTPYMNSIMSNRRQDFDHEPTAEESAGAYRIYHRTAGTDSSGNTWTEAWIVHWQVDDSISTAPVTLTGDDIITDQDGEVYKKAIQYNITANTAYGNMETLHYNHGVWQQKFAAGNPPAKAYGDIEQMEVGETYTVSCWARVISGDGAWMKFGWGGTYSNAMGFPADRSGVSDWVVVDSAAWKRLSWSFVFNPTGDHYTETTADGVTTRTYNWEKRVAFGVARKYTSVIQLTGFRLTKGGLYGNNTIDTLAAQIKDLEARVAELQATVLENA